MGVADEIGSEWRGQGRFRNWLWVKSGGVRVIGGRD